jgi:hypothetical protein
MYVNKPALELSKTSGAMVCARERITVDAREKGKYGVYNACLCPKSPFEKDLKGKW